MLAQHALATAVAVVVVAAVVATADGGGVVASLAAVARLALVGGLAPLAVSLAVEHRACTLFCVADAAAAAATAAGAAGADKK